MNSFFKPPHQKHSEGAAKRHVKEPKPSQATKTPKPPSRLVTPFAKLWPKRCCHLNPEPAIEAKTQRSRRIDLCYLSAWLQPRTISDSSKPWCGKDSCPRNVNTFSDPMKLPALKTKGLAARSVAQSSLSGLLSGKSQAICRQLAIVVVLTTQ